MDPANPSKIQRYLKSKTKENLVAGVLVFAAAIILAVFMLAKVVDISVNNPNDYSNVMGWVSFFDNYLQDIAAGLVFMLPSVALFVIGYLLLEANPLGWKLSCCVAVIAAVLGLTSIIDPIASILIVLLTTNAATIGKLTKIKQQININSSIITENIAKLGLRTAGIICAVIFIGITIYVVARGIGYTNLGFLTGTWSSANAKDILLANPASTDFGGISIFVTGTLMIVTICEAIAIPLGIGAAIYLSEYAPQNRLTETIRFFIETLAGVPSVIIGIVGLMLLCEALGWHQSLLPAGLSLAMMILPWNIRVSEEALRSVPASYREGAYALGATQSQAIAKIVLYAASPGIITGIILGIGAAMGETAVVVLTAGHLIPNSLPTALTGGTQQVPVLTIWIEQVWRDLATYKVPSLTSMNVAYAGALVLICIFIVVCVIGMLIRNHLHKKITGQK
jgi:phosphate transport system permease protein